MSAEEPVCWVGRSGQSLFLGPFEPNWAKGQVRDSFGTPQKYAWQLLQHSARLSKERGVPIGEGQIS